MAEPHRHPLVMPDLDLADTPLVVTAWLAMPGREVIEGDRILEISAGDVTVDLSAPITGRLVERLVAEDDPVKVGQVLAVIEAAGE